MKLRTALPFFLLALVLSRTVLATPTSFYVDPGYTGQLTNGTEAEPWTWLSTNEWKVINDSLGAVDVTVFFSSNRSSSEQLMLKRTDRSTHRLTLDGMSKMNLDTSNPRWTQGDGSRFFIDYYSAGIHTGWDVSNPADYITIRGFRVRGRGKGVIIYAANYFVLEDCEVEAAPDSNIGPLVYLTYAREEGSTESPCVPDSRHNCGGFHDITLRNNFFHDSYGEILYVGGLANHDIGGVRSWRNLLVEDNTFANAAVWGGQADAIDIKDGLKGVIVRGNTVYMEEAGLGRDGINCSSHCVVEKNFIYNYGRAGIVLEAYWNKASNVRQSSVVRDNIVVRTGGNPKFSWDFGIIVDGAATGDNFVSVSVVGNTVYDTQGDGSGIAISKYAEGATLKNNVVFNIASPALTTGDRGVFLEHDFNLLYSHGEIVVRAGREIYSSEQITDFEPNSISSDPLFIDTEPPYKCENFMLQRNSPAVGAGEGGVNMGAGFCEPAELPGAPRAPRGLRIIDPF